MPRMNLRDASYAAIVAVSCIAGAVLVIFVVLTVGTLCAAHYCS